MKPYRFTLLHACMHRKMVIRKSIIILNMFAGTSVRSKELAINVKNDGNLTVTLQQDGRDQSLFVSS